MERCRYYAITSDGVLQRKGTVEEALQARDGGGFAWLDFTDPAPEHLTALVEPLGLHPLAIEDCLDADQVPKLDEFDGHTFILFNRYCPMERSARIEEVNFFLGADFLVTVHSHGIEDESFADHLESTVRRDLAQARGGPDHLFEVILDEIVDEKFGAVEGLQDQLDLIEERILANTLEFRPSDLVRLRRTLLSLRKSLVYEREILVKLCRKDSPYVSEDAIYQFRDVHDHLAKFFETVEICREMITSIMEIYLATINNRMTLVASRTNLVMRRLTMITTVFMPLTLLSGIGGMSEWSMMTGSENWRTAYPLFLAAMVVIGAGNYCLLKWFDRRDRPHVLPSWPEETDVD